MNMSDDTYNVLILMTDRHRADCLGSDGNACIRTPHLDSLATEGVRFSSAFTANPFCMPTRFSLLTGRYPHSHGCWDNGILMPDDTMTLAQRFTGAGYHTALIGKGHLKPFRFKGEQESFDEWEKTDPRWASWHGPYFGFEEVHLTVGHHLPLGHYGMFLRQHHPEAIQLKYLLEEVAEEYNCELLSFHVSKGTVSFSFDNDELTAEILKILQYKKEFE